MDWEAYEDCGDVVAADEAGYGFEVGFEGGAVDREERLGGVAEGVGQGYADAAVSYVEREDAVEGHGLQCRRVGVRGLPLITQSARDEWGSRISWLRT